MRACWCRRCTPCTSPCAAHPDCRPSESGDAWDSFSHDHSRSRAYRWNEDGLAGVCNRHQNIVMSVGLWNTHDPIIKVQSRCASPWLQRRAQLTHAETTLAGAAVWTHRLRR